MHWLLCDATFCYLSKILFFFKGIYTILNFKFTDIFIYYAIYDILSNKQIQVLQINLCFETFRSISKLFNITEKGYVPEVPAYFRIADQLMMHQVKHSVHFHSLYTMLENKVEQYWKFFAMKKNEV